MKKPDFITFTGLDDHTSLDEAAALQRRYPIEFGLLFSEKRQGSGRYPSIRTVEDSLLALPGSVSAHLCGSIAREVASKGTFAHTQGLVRSALFPMLGRRRSFSRIQVNAPSNAYNLDALADFQVKTRAMVIAQARGPAFPEDERVLWLHDESCGRGASAKHYPPANQYKFVGYAGGINPANVLTVIESVSAVCSGAYWLDMETGVRDSTDRFSLDACRRVCEAVYPAR